MTYVKSIIIDQPDRVQHTLGVPASMNLNTKIPCDATTIEGISNNSGQLVIDSGKSVLLTAGAFIDRRTAYTAGYLTYQWYDVTNSQWLGRSCRISTATWNNTTNRYKVQQFARCIVITSSQTTVELRIKEINNVSAINEFYNGTNDFAAVWAPTPWYSVLCF